MIPYLRLNSELRLLPSIVDASLKMCIFSSSSLYLSTQMVDTHVPLGVFPPPSPPPLSLWPRPSSTHDSLALGLLTRDEEVMQFLSTTEQRWRVYWTFEIVGLRFWLTTVGVLCVGNASSVSPSFAEDSFDVSYFIRPYFVFASTPRHGDGALVRGQLTCCAPLP